MGKDQADKDNLMPGERAARTCAATNIATWFASLNREGRKDVLSTLHAVRDGRHSIDKTLISKMIVVLEGAHEDIKAIEESGIRAPQSPDDVKVDPVSGAPMPLGSGWARQG